MTAETVHHRAAHPGLIDPAAEPHLAGVFEPVVDEVDLVDLPVVGALPADLDGVYLRNGPNPRFSPIGSYIYPLDGDAMVHAIRISEGRASYSNRFVRTAALVAEETAGRALWGGIMSPLPSAEEVGPELAGTRRELPDINVVRHGGKLLALAESDLPYCLSSDLATLGKESFAGELPVGITAHPKIDATTGEMAVFCYQLEPPYLTWSMIDRHGVVVRPATEVVGVDRPIMVHDMALTAKYLVLVLSPLFFDMQAVMRGGSLLSWEPDRGVRVALIPRDGGPVRWASTDAFWMWHAANAFDLSRDGAGDAVVMDYVQWTTPGMGISAAPRGGMARAVIDVESGRIDREQLDDIEVEFPRIDDRVIGREHQVIAVGAKTGKHSLTSGAYDGIRWYRPGTGSSVSWSSGNLAVGEPAYVPKPGDPDQAHGWWVTFAIDLETRASQFLVIPAEDPAAGPVAAVQLPVRVPLGLHGNWLPTEE